MRNEAETRKHPKGAFGIAVLLALLFLACGTGEATNLMVSYAGDDGRAGAERADGVSGTVRVGRGLLGMRERAALYGGTLETGPVDGRGWTVRLDLPRSAS